MISRNYDWAQFKAFLTQRSALHQHFEETNAYVLWAYDGPLEVTCTIFKTDPVNADQLDFETNYKATSNKRLEAPKDVDGSSLQRTKITTYGWHYQLHGTEFESSNLSSIVAKKADGTDFLFATIKCYDANGVLLTTQEECDASAVKTVVDWEPTHDYEIVGGLFKQHAIPTENVRLWVVGVPDVPDLYGGSKAFATNVNLKFMGVEEGVSSDGRAPKFLAYSAITHSNKLRIILTHPAGHKHEVHVLFEIFKK